MERLERYAPLDLLFEVLKKQHEMEELSGQLVPKLYDGICKWQELNAQANADRESLASSGDQASAIMKSNNGDDFQPVLYKN